LSLRGLALFAIQAGQPEMRLRGERGIFLQFDNFQPGLLGSGAVTAE